MATRSLIDAVYDLAYAVALRGPDAHLASLTVTEDVAHALWLELADRRVGAPPPFDRGFELSGIRIEVGA